MHAELHAWIDLMSSSPRLHPNCPSMYSYDHLCFQTSCLCQLSVLVMHLATTPQQAINITLDHLNNLALLTSQTGLQRGNKAPCPT